MSMYLQNVTDELFLLWHDKYTEMKQETETISDDGTIVQTPLGKKLRNELNEISEAIVILQTHKQR